MGKFLNDHLLVMIMHYPQGKREREKTMNSKLRLIIAFLGLWGTGLWGCGGMEDELLSETNGKAEYSRQPIYGRITSNGKIFAGAEVTVKCGDFDFDSFEMGQIDFIGTTKTDKDSRYELDGPPKEEWCTATVKIPIVTIPCIDAYEDSNPVSFATRGTSRTRVNLEFFEGRLYRR